MRDIYSCKILIVDDEAALCNMIKEILMQAGFLAVYTAQSCTEARQAAGDIRPEAILLDVMLPDGDGFSLLQELRRERDVPILFLPADPTGH